MVLESLIFPLKAEQRPWQMFFIGMLYTTVAVFLSLWIFETQASFIMVFLTTLACVPIIYNTMKLEENKDMEIQSELNLIKEHDKAIFFMMFLFLGITLASVLWYIVLPIDAVNNLFDAQAKTIATINNQISGDTVQSFNILNKIFFNNLKVLVLSILFSFIYGMGAIFILAWNATVIGTAIGNFIRSNVASILPSSGLVTASAHFQIVSLGLLRYVIHGIPEIMAYFYGALAGGIISIAITRHHYSSEKFAHILTDVAELIAISVGFLLIAAILEVYITPLLF